MALERQAEAPREAGLWRFLPGESHGQKSLVGYSPWGLKSQTRLHD